MRRKSVMLIALVALAVLAVGAVALRLYLGRAAELRLRPDEIVDFAARGSAGRENVFAMCPAMVCTPPPDRESPIFATDWRHLRALWDEVVAAEPRVEQVAGDPGGRRVTYIQRTALLLFPDIVTVEFVPLGDARASLAIDSRSRYGRGDFGVNRRRVLAWVGKLAALAGAPKAD